jgi:hypothetical protein
MHQHVLHTLSIWCVIRSEALCLHLSCSFWLTIYLRTPVRLGQPDDTAPAAFITTPASATADAEWMAVEARAGTQYAERSSCRPNGSFLKAPGSRRDRVGSPVRCCTRHSRPLRSSCSLGPEEIGELAQQATIARPVPASARRAAALRAVICKKSWTVPGHSRTPCGTPASARQRAADACRRPAGRSPRSSGGAAAGRAR